jgi:hypothetical protein
MNVITIKKFLEETKFEKVNYQIFEEGDLQNYELFEFVTNDEQKLGIAINKGLFNGCVRIYKNEEFTVHFNTILGKWILKQIIKDAFSKHFDDILENWNKKKN